MKKYIILFSIALVVLQTQAQDYYWHKGEKIHLTPVPTKRFIIFNSLDDTIVLKNEFFKSGITMDAPKKVDTYHSDTLNETNENIGQPLNVTTLGEQAKRVLLSMKLLFF